ncbi:hypothetical protein COX97_01870 [Candidatus Pacearchaeota archaeon CG_4_10_14_0_2_um_filter_05_32_18]|nr:MAG: hypothetical protein AUJ62_00170 [Candidatus Pacearchaeota archaeon CG1_02_32_21]PIZ83028.1 MAG: hypothetical protein COX97_01870 [Candidatus Pacearchaeota archaeon CG_4_10_14_0_2_um_filter_05_32_18]
MNLITVNSFANNERIKTKIILIIIKTKRILKKNFQLIFSLSFPTSRYIETFIYKNPFIKVWERKYK